MDLLEYQAKELFGEMGIPVLPSQRIDHPQDIKALKIPYPVVLKSQVRRGGRGRAGGIKVVTNTIDAVAAAQAIFNLPIMEEYPEVLLAEAKYDVEQEIYLAVALDSSARRPVLLGSPQGGIRVASTVEQMQHVVVEQEFSAFYARRLTLKMGLQGRLIQSVSAVIEKMYWLFQQKDLDLVEINPLGINSSGDVMALDGKITVNGGALGRHADLSLLAAKRVKSVYLGKAPLSRPGVSSDRRPLTSTSPPSSSAYTLLSASHFVELEGTIGILCNGAGLTMTTLDLVYQAGGKPANFLNLGGESFYGWNPENFHSRLKQGLTLVTQAQAIQVLLINILGSVISCYEIAQVITTHLKQLPRTPLKLVVRLVGHESDRARDYLSTLQIPLVEQLDEAIVQAVALGKSRTKQA